MAMERISITPVFLFQVPDRIQTRFWAKNVVFSKKNLFKQTTNLTDPVKMYIDGLTGIPGTLSDHFHTEPIDSETLSSQ